MKRNEEQRGKRSEERGREREKKNGIKDAIVIDRQSFPILLIHFIFVQIFLNCSLIIYYLS